MAPKQKAQKMSIGTFLADENLGSWADEMEDMPLPVAPESRSGFGGERRPYSSTAGFGNDFADRPSFSRIDLPLPTQPPYTAHVGNLSFDATSSDVTDLFADCEVTNVRIVEDKLTRVPKGFGYVEFASVEGLKKALTFSGTSLQGRGIRVSIAEPPKESQQSRDFSDWSRKGPLPDVPRRGNDRPGYNRNFPDNVSEAGSERGERRRFDAGDGKPRDFGNWERKGPLSPSAAPAGREGGRQQSNEGSGFRRSSPAWGEGRSQDGSRPPRREFQERPERVERPERTPTAADLDNQWRSRMRPDAPAPSPKEASNPPSPVATAAAPAARPKLNLQKRTVSENAPSSPATTGDSKASPFGAARPIDTAAREREVADKRERARKEAEEKAKAEKAEKAGKQRQAKEQAKAEKGAATDADGAKEADSEAAKVKSFEILRRTEEDDSGMTADQEVDEPTEESGSTKEASNDAPATRTNGGWKNSAAPAAEGTEATDAHGWSTVSATKRNNRRGQGRG